MQLPRDADSTSWSDTHMEWLRRHPLAAGLILLLVVALLGWQWLPEEAPPPASAARHAPTQSPPTGETPSPASASPSPPAPADVSVPADEPARASVGALRGRAFDAFTDEPMTKFEITWREPIGEPRQQFASRRRTFETTDGRFEYTDVPAGKWGIIVTARGYQRFEVPELKITGGTEQEVLVPLQKGHTLRGRVYDQATGTGIAASIDVLDSRIPAAFRSPRPGTAQATAADGSFVIEGLPPGRTDLAIDANNYSSRTVGVEVGANTPSLEIGLSAGATIAGRFTTAAGDPIAGGSVALYRPDGSLVATRDTDVGGTFEFRDLDAGTFQLAGKHRSALVTQDVTLSGGTANVQLALAAGRTIRGTVTGLRPDLLAQVNVTVRRDGEMQWTPNRVNERGEFELNDVAPGPVRVVADVNRTREVSKSIEMPAHADVTVNLDFPAGATLSGRVTRDSKPLPDLLVVVDSPNPRHSANSHHTKTSSAGTYSVQNLEPGEYVVMVGNYISKPLQIHGAAVFDVDMPGGDLTGRVLDDATGAPLANASVDLYFADTAASPLRINRFTDHLGNFSIAGTVPSEYVLTVYRPGYRLYREPLSFDAQSPALTIRLREDKGVEIRGRDAAGQPVRGIMVIESIAGRGGFTIELPLDERGIGYLPSGLAGSKLQLIALGVGSVQIPSWNGAALDLRFGPATQQ
jgi:hypothetical protein